MITTTGGQTCGCRIRQVGEVSILRYCDIHAAAFESWEVARLQADIMVTLADELRELREKLWAREVASR